MKSKLLSLSFLCFDANKTSVGHFEYPVVLIDHEEPEYANMIYKDFEHCLLKNTVPVT